MYNQQGISQYQKIAINTMTSERMIVLLYDGMFRFLERARRAMANNDLETRLVNINKAKAIIDELCHSLNHDIGADFTHELEALYQYASHELTEAVITNDSVHINHVMRVMEPLHRAWSAIPNGSSRQSDHRETVLDSVETHNISTSGMDPAVRKTSGPGGSGPESSQTRKTNLCVAV